jgi:hypothetical protein
MPTEGERRVHRQTGQVAVYTGGRWVSEPSPLRQQGMPLRESSQDRASRSQAAQDAIRMQSVDRQAREFMAAHQDVATGGLWNLPLGHEIRQAVNPDFARMRSIQEELTPSQREPGSGAMSDRDVEMYRRATLNVSAPGPANAQNARVLRAAARNQADYSAFVDEWARANGGSLAGATERWMEYSNANPMFDDNGQPVGARVSWRQHFGLERPQRQAPPPPTTRPAARGPSGRTYTPAQVQAARSIAGGPRGRLGSATNPHMVNSPEQARRLPRGAHFIDENGRNLVRQ